MGNHVCCAELLIGGTEDALRRDARGNLPLHKAAERCGARMVEVLCGAGAEVEAIDKASRSTALHLATKAGNLDTALPLIARRPCLDWLDPWNRTAPHWAAYNGHLEICQSLVEAKATVIGTLGEHGKKRFVYTAEPCGNVPQRVAKRLASLENPVDIARARFGEEGPLISLLRAAQAASTESKPQGTPAV